MALGFAVSGLYKSKTIIKNSTQFYLQQTLNSSAIGWGCSGRVESLDFASSEEVIRILVMQFVKMFCLITL
jgi:hypothetical protein